MELFDDMGKKGIDVLFVHLMHQYTTMGYKKFMNLGVHPGQLPVLKILSQEEGASQKELAERIHVKPPTITVTVQRLEKAGMVRREADWLDQRKSRIFLTDKGKEVVDEILEICRESEKALIEGFSEEELDQLRGYFLRMIENLKQIGGTDEEFPVG